MCNRFHAAAVLSVLFPALSWGAPQVIRLGFLGDSSPSLAMRVSADGSTVVGLSLSLPGFEAFRWQKPTGMIGLGDLPGGAFSSQAFGVSANGTVIVGGSDDGSAGEEGAAFVWTPATGMKFLGSLGGPTTYGQGFGVSDNGQVIVGQSQSLLGVEAFLWTPGTGMVGLGDLAGGTFFSCAVGVSGDGRVVCGTGTGTTGQQPFSWTQATGMIPLDTTGVALAVSHDGRVIVGSSRGNAVRWTPTGKQTLFQTMDRTNSWAFGCSADGNTVVGLANYSATLGTGEAFIWDPVHGERGLRGYLASRGVNVANAQFLSARSVSADGKTIVGYGDFGSGQEAFAVILDGPTRVVLPGIAN